MTERKEIKTIRLYENDPEMRSFCASVISCEGEGEKYKVVLDRTAFFPTGGGQSCDTGRINDIPVTDVYLDDGSIVHIVSSPVRVGSEVACELDYDERERKMQSHTAEHILSAVLKRRFDLNNVGFHLGSADTTCDFDGMLSYEELCSAEDEVNAVIRGDHVVYAFYPGKDELKTIDYRSKLELSEDVRIVAIGENGIIDKCACCAPHVSSTGKIGLFRIIDFYRYKGGMRVHILTGQAALNKVRQDCEGIRTLSAMLSAKPLPYEVVSAVVRLENENKSLKTEISELNLLLNSAVCSTFSRGENVCHFDPRTDTEALRRLALSAYDKTGQTVAVFGKGENNYRFVLCGENAKGLFESLKKSLDMKGGGKDVICGTVDASEEEIRCAVSSFQ